jgi:predicted protein tyrosine phosphatase
MIVLGIPDDDGYMDQKLISLLRQRVIQHLL